MDTAKLKLPRRAIEYLKSEGFETLYPPQADCVKSGLLDGASLLVSAPTASGKTLIAILAMLSYLSKHGGKVVYLSPLRALAAEKFDEFKKLEKIMPQKNIKVAISTGDFESAGRSLARSSILVLTNERMDSLIRHRVDWIEDVGLVIADEVHLIGDEDRGPTLEMILTQLKLSESNPQIVGLSATVTNSKAIADWLGCKLVKNDWRPVPLTEGVTDGGTVLMNDGTEFQFRRSTYGTPIDLGVQSVMDGGQSLIFASTRARSKSTAVKASKAVLPHVSRGELEKLAGVSKEILDKNEHTEMVKTLASLVKQGVAFHHAGLNQTCRSIIETEFKRGTIKLLSSTPTLAAGVNLPARRVIISSISRYDAKLGINSPISILEYKQLCGRAGRPQFDDYGQSIIVGNKNADELIDRYIKGRPEPIKSKLTGGKSFRTHILSVIVTRPGIKKAALLDVFLQTLGGMQSNKSTVKFALDVALRSLSSFGMIAEESDRYAATKFGEKTSTLYIDPLTATDFKKAASSASRARDHTLGFLHLISSSQEFFPQFYMRDSDYDAADALLRAHSKELLDRTTYHECSRSLLALHAWISERTELYLSDTLGIESGDMHRIVESADRLAYCLRAIALHAGRRDLLDELDTLRTRINYGIKAELAGLVKIKGVGRVRARALYRSKIRNLDDLDKMPVNQLSRIGKIGTALATDIKSQLMKIRH